MGNSKLQSTSRRPAFCWKWTQRSVLLLILLLLLLLLPQSATDNGVRDGRSNRLVTPPLSWAVPTELHVLHSVNAAYKSQELYHQPGLERASTGMPYPVWPLMVCVSVPSPWSLLVSASSPYATNLISRLHLI